MPDKTVADGVFDLPYGVANQHMAHVATRMGVTAGFWHSIGHSHNALFPETFIDEVAEQSRWCPMGFRRRLLRDAPRYLASCAWRQIRQAGAPVASSPFLGRALHESFGSIVPQVVEVSLRDGKPRVQWVVGAADCRTDANSGIVAQQMESSVLCVLSAALGGKVDMQNDVVPQTDFPTSPAVMMNEASPGKTWLIPWQGRQGWGLSPGGRCFAMRSSGQQRRSLPLEIRRDCLRQDFQKSICAFKKACYSRGLRF